MKARKIIFGVTMTFMLAMLGFVSEAFAAVPGDYDEYASDYVYHRLDASEKALFDGLKTVCEKYMTTDIDISDEDGYELDFVPYEDIDDDRLYELIQLFGFQYPQYFFLSNSYSILGDSVALCAIPQFAKGTDRLDARDKMFADIDEIAAGVDGTDYEKEKALHDIVCAHVEYAKNELDQSAYSAWLTKSSVCAGYSKYFALLLNKAGVESLIVSSKDHAWNKVKLDGKWYVTDVTWDDTTYWQYDHIVYYYFNKSDSYMEEEDGTEGLIGGHKTLEIYDGKVPEADEDYETTPTYSLITEIKIAPSGTDGYSTSTCTVEKDATIGLKYGITKTHGDIDGDETFGFEYSESGIAEVQTVLTQSGRTGYKIKGLKAGTVTVTAYTANGVKAKPLTVTVTEVLKTEEPEEHLSEAVETVNPVTEDTNTVSDNTAVNDPGQVTNVVLVKSEEESVYVPASSFKKAVSKKKKKLTLRWKKVKNAGGYEIWLSYSKNFKKGLKKFTIEKNKTTSKTISKLKSKKKCFVKIRAYSIVNGKKYYSSWSKVKSVKIK